MVSIKEAEMNSIGRAVAGFVTNQDGATFLEYTVILCIMLMVPAAVLWSVSGWAGDQWFSVDSLLNDIGAKPKPACCANAAASNVPGKCCN